MAIRKVTLLGADGELGPAILNSLIQAFSVTVLKRSNSTSPDNYPPNVRIAKVDPSFNVEDLVPILRGQDALVVTIKGTQVDLQKRLAEAAVQAGVQRLIPADFGSCDSASPHAQECVPLFKNKTELRSYLMVLAAKHEQFTWTAVVGGHFFDWQPAFLHLYPKELKADLLDDGNAKSSYSTLARVAEATSRVLRLPEKTANKVCFVQSFCLTQMDILNAFEKASGKKWTRETLEAKAYEREQLAKRDEGSSDAVENLVWLLGSMESDWTTKEEFAMKLLGLEDEDLDGVVGKLWDDWK